MTNWFEHYSRVRQAKVLSPFLLITYMGKNNLITMNEHQRSLIHLLPIRTIYVTGNALRRLLKQPYSVV